jgi:tetratricopeptide (TPR) repeat protein
LANADASIVDRADKAAWSLEPVQTCSNTGALLAPSRPPPGAEARIEAVHVQLAAAKAALSFARFEIALTDATNAVDTGRAIGFAPVIAEALLVRGEVLVSQGRAKDATPVFADAVGTAYRGRRDDVVAQASMDLASVLTVRLGMPDEGAIWLGLAKAAMVGAGDPRWERELLNETGILAGERGDLVAAIAAHREVLEREIREFGATNPIVWNRHVTLAATLSKLGDWGAARPHFESALALREAAVGPDHPDVGLILSNLGSVYEHLGEHAKARTALERSLAIRERVFGTKSGAIIATLNNLADFLVKQGDVSIALSDIERAESIGITVLGNAHPTYHTVLTTRGEVLLAAGRAGDAGRALDDALRLEEKTHSPMHGLTLAARAEVALAESKWADAAGFARRSIADFEAAGGVDDSNLLRSLTALGRAQVGLAQLRDARTTLARAIEIGEKAKVGEPELAPARKALALSR